MGTDEKLNMDSQDGQDERRQRRLYRGVKPLLQVDYDWGFLLFHHEAGVVRLQGVAIDRYAVLLER